MLTNTEHTASAGADDTRTIAVTIPLEERLIDKAQQDYGITVDYHPELSSVQTADEALAKILPLAKTCRILTVGEIALDRRFFEALGESGQKPELIVRVGNDLSSIDVDAAHEQGIQVINTPGMRAQPVANFMMQQIGHLSLMEAQRRAKEDEQPLLTPDLAHKKIAMLGTGEVGKRLIYRLQGLNDYMSDNITAWSPNFTPEMADHLHVKRATSKSDAVKDADIVCVALDAHEPVIDRHMLDKMKPGAMIVSVSRFSAFDMTALEDAVKEKNLKVALDSRKQDGEQLEQEHPELHECAFITPALAYRTPSRLENETELLFSVVDAELNQKALSTEQNLNWVTAIRKSHNDAKLVEQCEADTTTIKRAISGADALPASVRDIFQKDAVLDMFHGEMSFEPPPEACQAMLKGYVDNLKGKQDKYTDPYTGNAYSKEHPAVLQHLASEKLFDRIRHPTDGNGGAFFNPKDVLITPYSSTLASDAVLRALAGNKRDAVVLAPKGHYKSLACHVDSIGLQMESIPVEADTKINAVELDRKLTALKRRSFPIAAVYLTLPGNPIVNNYSREEMEAIGKVLLKHDVPYVVDAIFDPLVSHSIPLASLTINYNGQKVNMLDKGVTVTGNSKAYCATGPEKFGAILTGDESLRAGIQKHLPTMMQRETTHLVQALMQNTGDEVIEGRRETLQENQRVARDMIQDINRKFHDPYGGDVLKVIGDVAEGQFLCVEFNKNVTDRMGVRDSVELSQYLLMATGIDTVPAKRAGIDSIAVRLNIHAPRLHGEKSQQYMKLFEERVSRLLGLLQDRQLSFGQLCRDYEVHLSYEHGASHAKQ